MKIRVFEAFAGYGSQAIAVESKQTESGTGYAEAEASPGYTLRGVVFLLVVVNVGLLLYDFLICSFHNYEVFL